jgi:hypothetical protein
MRRTHHHRIWLAAGIFAFFAIAAWNYRQYRIPPAPLQTRAGEIFTLQSDPPPAIDAPVFERVALADPHLKDDGYGIDVEVDGRHRFYPYQILVWHEVVNDVFRGKPLLVVYAPLANAGLVFERPARDGEDDLFESSSSLSQGVRMFRDRATGSLWHPIFARALEGPRTGERFTRRSSQIMTWFDWKIRYPTGEVLARVASQDRDYTLDPYAEYQKGQAVWFPISFQDPRFPAKEMILGVESPQVAAAYRLSDIQSTPINDMIGPTPVLLVYDPAFRVVRAFKRETSRGLDTFQLDDGELLDSRTGSSWNFQGVAESGPLRRERLEPLQTTQMYWFAWVSAHPDTQAYLP